MRSTARRRNNHQPVNKRACRRGLRQLRVRPGTGDDHFVPPVLARRYPIVDALHDKRPRAHGEGVVLVVNPAAGSGTGQRVIARVHNELPKAETCMPLAADPAVYASARTDSRLIARLSNAAGWTTCAARKAVD